MIRQSRRTRLLHVVLLAAALLSTARADEPGFEVPGWAFPVFTNPPPAGVKVDDVAPLYVPDSGIRYTRAELENLFAAPDWFPERHPLMPKVVAQGRPPDTLACAYCHLPDGTGRPENAALAGRSPSYLLRQMLSFKTGTRSSAAAAAMQPVVANMGLEDMIAVAAYAATLEP